VQLSAVKRFGLVADVFHHVTVCLSASWKNAVHCATKKNWSIIRHSPPESFLQKNSRNRMFMKSPSLAIKHIPDKLKLKSYH
jgi:hypothetical protein